MAVKWIRVSLGVACAMLVAIAFAACGGSGGSGSGGSSGTTAAAKDNLPAGPITIGMAIGKTGFMVPYDSGPANAAQLAVDDINARGGVLGHKLQLTSADTKSDRAQGATAADTLISGGANVIMVSCDFDFGSPATIAATSRQKVALTPCAASPQFDVATLGPLAYSLALASPAEAAEMAQWAHARGWTKAYVMLDPTVQFEKTWCSAFEDKWKQLGGSIVGSDSFQQTDTSISGQISRLSSANPRPDFVAFCSYPPGGATALRQIRGAGIDLPMVTGDGFDGSYWLRAVPNLSNFYVISYGSLVGNDPRPDVNAFIARYARRFGGPPAISHAITGYALVQVVAAGIEKARTTDGPALAKAIDSLGPIDTILGPTQFTPGRHLSYDRPMAILQIQNGRSSVSAIYGPNGKVG